LAEFTAIIFDFYQDRKQRENRIFGLKNERDRRYCGQDYDTNHNTIMMSLGRQVPQVIENLVELVGLEPTTSAVRLLRSPN
jgi:hypothetical protein